MTSAASTFAPDVPVAGTARRHTIPARPRLTAVPDCEPPFDDERTGTDRLAGLQTGSPGRQQSGRTDKSRRRPGRTGSTAASVATAPAPTASVTTASAPTAPVTTASVTTARPRGAALSGLATAVAVASPLVPDLSRADDVGVRRTPAAQLPPAKQAGTGYARALVEVLTGVRPVQQLRAHCTPPVFAGLDERTPLPGTGLARLHSAHVAEPVDGVAEVSAVFRRGPRMRAIAFRLEGLDGRWRISSLQVG